MSSVRKRNIVDLAVTGRPLTKARRCETIQFTIYDYETMRNKEVSSPIMRACGLQWRIVRLWNGCRLKLLAQNIGFPQVSARARVCCKGFDSGFRNISESSAFRFEPTEHLEDDGSLVIEIDIELNDEKMSVWFPPEIQQQDKLVELYTMGSPKSDDTIFSIGKRTFRVHKDALALQRTKLQEIANGSNGDSPIPLPSVSEETFEIILRFLYTVDTEPRFKNKQAAKEVLIAADQFECVQLKLYTESLLVQRYLDVKNIVSLLLLADSHSCALLKEAAMTVFAENAKTVTKSKSWSKIQESNKLLSELIDRLACPLEHNADIIDRMTISSLRRELEYAKQDLDGSREVLVKRLETVRKK